LLNNRKNEGYKITDLTTITMGIKLKKTIPKFTHYPINKKPHSKNYRAPKFPEYGDEITRRAYTLLILYHHTQNGTTVLDSRFQHSTG
jgi:hypothetical protein